MKVIKIYGREVMLPFEMWQKHKETLQEEFKAEEVKVYNRICEVCRTEFSATETNQTMCIACVLNKILGL